MIVIDVPAHPHPGQSEAEPDCSDCGEPCSEPDFIEALGDFLCPVCIEAHLEAHQQCT